jgi:hypothetical protein
LREIGEEMQSLSRLKLPAFNAGMKGLKSPLDGSSTAVSESGGRQPVSVNFYGNLEFKDEAMVRTFIEYLQTMGDDLALSGFQGSPLGI